MSAGSTDPRTLTNSELIQLVELPEAHDGLRYYLAKAAKIELLEGATPERTTELLDVAQARRSEHHALLRTRRQDGPVDKAALIEQKLGDESWSYVEHQRTDGFRDDCTGRKATLAFVLQGTKSGRTIQVTRNTVEHAHAHLRPITNWPPPRGRRPLQSREARAAGVVTLADIG